MNKVVFAHTHQPLAGAFARGCGGVSFWNTGSWIYEPSLGSFRSYLDYLARAWPGTAVLVDTEQPEPVLIETLADQNPLKAAGRAPGASCARRRTCSARAGTASPRGPGQRR